MWKILITFWQDRLSYIQHYYTSPEYWPLAVCIGRWEVKEIDTKDAEKMIQRADLFLTMSTLTSVEPGSIPGTVFNM